MAAVPGPAAISRGDAGVLRCGGLVVARLTAWEVVISPTTGMPTLKATGRVRRWAIVAQPARLVAELTPATAPARIGRPRPRAPEPFTLAGRVARLTPTAVTLAEGEIL